MVHKANHSTLLKLAATTTSSGNYNLSSVVVGMLTTLLNDHAPCFHSTRCGPLDVYYPHEKSPFSPPISTSCSRFPHESGNILALLCISSLFFHAVDWFYDFSYKAMTTYHAISFMCALFHSESRIGLALSAFIPSFLPVIKALYLFRPSTVVPRLSARSNTPGIVPSHGPDPNTS